MYKYRDIYKQAESRREYIWKMTTLHPSAGYFFTFFTLLSGTFSERLGGICYRVSLLSRRFGWVVAPSTELYDTIWLYDLMCQDTNVYSESNCMI